MLLIYYCVIRHIITYKNCIKLFSTKGEKIIYIYICIVSEFYIYYMKRYMTKLKFIFYENYKINAKKRI